MPIRYDVARGVGGDYVEVAAGPLKQPSYTRGDTTLAKSGVLLTFRNCIAGLLSKHTTGDRAKVRLNFCMAAKMCSKAKLDKAAAEKACKEKLPYLAEVSPTI